MHCTVVKMLLPWSWSGVQSKLGPQNAGKRLSGSEVEKFASTSRRASSVRPSVRYSSVSRCSASGTWFVLESHANHTTWQWFGWGVATDTPMPGDYDGDGKTDGAVYRSTSGTWYVRPSSGATQWNVVFGASGDVPLITIR